VYNRKTKRKKRICSEVTVKVWEIHVGLVSLEEGCGGKDLQKRKLLSLE